jgi:hypothetical protein
MYVAPKNFTLKTHINYPAYPYQTATLVNGDIRTQIIPNSEIYSNQPMIDCQLATENSNPYNAANVCQVATNYENYMQSKVRLMPINECANLFINVLSTLRWKTLSHIG